MSEHKRKKKNNAIQPLQSWPETNPHVLRAYPSTYVKPTQYIILPDSLAAKDLPCICRVTLLCDSNDLAFRKRQISRLNSAEIEQRNRTTDALSLWKRPTKRTIALGLTVVCSSSIYSTGSRSKRVVLILKCWSE
jgi:hypothetical protein